MTYRTKHYARYLRQLRHLKKLCAKYQQEGREHSRSLLIRIKAKLRFLVAKLRGNVAPKYWIGTVSCVIAFLCASIGNVMGQSFKDPVVNPFQLNVQPQNINHSVVDIDNDGDMDLILANYTEEFVPQVGFAENISTDGTPEFAPIQTIPINWNGHDPEYFYYDMGDLDNDGDIDILAYTTYVYDYETYEYFATLAYVENTGTPQQPIFEFNSLDTLTTEVPAAALGIPRLADLDGDGDLDLMMDMAMSDPYSSNGQIRWMYFENSGTPAEFSFESGILEPFEYEFPPNGQYMLSAFGDVDDDGDLDILGQSAYYDEVSMSTHVSWVYFENSGDPLNPQFGAPVFDPFGLPEGGFDIDPCVHILADWDQDGDLDLSCALYDYYYGTGGMIYYENTQISSVSNYSHSQLLFEFSPNPVSDFLTVTFKADRRLPVEVEILDVLGRLIYVRETQDEVLQIDCADWNPGTYIIRMKSEKGISSALLEKVGK